MPGAQDRRLHIRDVLGAQEIPWVFFDALDAVQASAMAARMGLQIKDGALSPGELGCLMSHVCLWQQLVESTEQTMAIAEDDIFLGRDAKVFFTQHDWIPAPATQKIVKLEKHEDPVALGRRSWPAHGRQLRLLRQDHWGTAAYVIGREAAAQLLVQLRSAPIARAVDHLIFDDFRLAAPRQVLQLLPAVAIQEKVLHDGIKLGNHIDAERVQHRAQFSSNAIPENKGFSRLLTLIYWRKKWRKIERKNLLKQLDFL
jgi:glycosyl transferase family 25